METIKKIQNITWLADERCTSSVQNVSWNTGDLDEIIGSIVDRSIIRCNYSDKFSYWNWNDNIQKEKWNQAAYIHNDTIP